MWQPSRSHRSVISTDTLVDGVHFLRERVHACDIGYKALAVNLSDLAAMGARPVLCVVALTAAPGIDEAWIREFYRGLTALAAKSGTAVAGGDLTRGPVTVVTVTVVGEASPTRIPLRCEGRPGDIIAVTGPLGGSRAGLAVVQSLRAIAPDAPPGETADIAERAAGYARRAEIKVDAKTAGEALRAHLFPLPRLHEGRFLAASVHVRAMMDLSDGIASDLRRLTAASGCGALLTGVPVASGVAEIAACAGADAQAWALGGGEDYELLATVAPRAFKSVAGRFAHRFGRSLLAVGRLTEGQEILLESGGETTPLAQHGWDHFASG